MLLSFVMKKRIGVLLSGRGSNSEALAESAASGRIPNAEIAIVISNREGAEGLERARARGIDARAIPSRGLEREAYDRLVVAALQEKKVDLVCLAGYMRLISPYFVSAFRNRILNIHPSLLPAFPGLEAQRQVIFRYTNAAGDPIDEANPNGSAAAIAGLCNEARNVVGLMPHPERACESALGSADGLLIFESVVQSMKSGALVAGT